MRNDARREGQRAALIERLMRVCGGMEDAEFDALVDRMLATSDRFAEIDRRSGASPTVREALLKTL